MIDALQLERWRQVVSCSAVNLGRVLDRHRVIGCCSCSYDAEGIRDWCCSACGGVISQKDLEGLAEELAGLIENMGNEKKETK